MTPPARTPRIEATLLHFLRACFPGVHFGSLRDKGNPPLECVLAGEPQGMATPVSQYVRLRLSVIARREDGTGDFAKAQRLASGIIRTITSQGCITPIVSAQLDAGPMRLADGDAYPIYCYAVLLLQVGVA